MFTSSRVGVVRERHITVFLILIMFCTFPEKKPWVTASGAETAVEGSELIINWGYILLTTHLNHIVQVDDIPPLDCPFILLFYFSPLTLKQQAHLEKITELSWPTELMVAILDCTVYVRPCRGLQVNQYMRNFDGEERRALTLLDKTLGLDRLTEALEKWKSNEDRRMKTQLCSLTKQQLFSYRDRHGEFPTLTTRYTPYKSYLALLKKAYVKDPNLSSTSQDVILYKNFTMYAEKAIPFLGRAITSLSQNERACLLNGKEGCDYACGLWSILHQIVLRSSSTERLAVLQVLQAFIRTFDDSRVQGAFVRYETILQAQHPMNTSSYSPILWLWYLHNTERQERGLERYPTDDQCPECYLQNAKETYIYTHLLPFLSSDTGIVTDTNLLEAIQSGEDASSTVKTFTAYTAFHHSITSSVPHDIIAAAHSDFPPESIGEFSSKLLTYQNFRKVAIEALPILMRAPDELDPEEKSMWLNTKKDCDFACGLWVLFHYICHRSPSPWIALESIGAYITVFERNQAFELMKHFPRIADVQEAAKFIQWPMFASDSPSFTSGHWLQSTYLFKKMWRVHNMHNQALKGDLFPSDVECPYCHVAYIWLKLPSSTPLMLAMANEAILAYLQYHYGYVTDSVEQRATETALKKDQPVLNLDSQSGAQKEVTVLSAYESLYYFVRHYVPPSVRMGLQKNVACLSDVSIYKAFWELIQNVTPDFLAAPEVLIDEVLSTRSVHTVSESLHDRSSVSENAQSNNTPDTTHDYMEGFWTLSHTILEKHDHPEAAINTLLKFIMCFSKAPILVPLVNANFYTIGLPETFLQLTTFRSQNDPNSSHFHTAPVEKRRWKSRKNRTPDSSLKTLDELMLRSPRLWWANVHNTYNMYMFLEHFPPIAECAECYKANGSPILATISKYLETRFGLNHDDSNDGSTKPKIKNDKRLQIAIPVTIIGLTLMILFAFAVVQYKRKLQTDTSSPFVSNETLLDEQEIMRLTKPRP